MNLEGKCCGTCEEEKQRDRNLHGLLRVLFGRFFIEGDMIKSSVEL